MLLACLALAVVSQGASTPRVLSDANFGSVHSYATPSAKDLSFQSLDWKDSIFDGLVESQRQDKPLVMWLYFGDPRGSC